MQNDIEAIARKLAANLSPDELREKWEARQSGAAPEKVITDQEREYWHRVFSTPETKPVLAISRRTACEMEYETARKKVWALLQLRAAHIADLENNPEFRWVFSEEEKTILKNLVRYFINDPECQYQLSKGLFLYGAPGTGKTEIMQVMERFCRENELSKAFEFTSLSRVHIQAKAEKDFDPIVHNVQKDRCFDEFGRFVGPVIRFGESLDINEALIEMRYERFKRYGQLTHFIANTTPNELENAFSPMIFDRLRSMCTSIAFRGESKRK